MDLETSHFPKKRRYLSFPEGGVSLSLTFSEKNPCYKNASYEELSATSFQELQKALFQFLKLRPRSVYECRKKLSSLDFLPQEIEVGIAFFIEKNWLNDVQFAEWLIEGTQNYRAVGTYAMKQKLVQKGIAKQIINELLDKLKDDASFIEQGKLLIQKQWFRFEKHEISLRQSKIKQYLHQRGFSYEDTQKIASFFQNH